MSAYELFIEADVLRARKDLPGHVRPRIKDAIAALAHEPRPPHSRPLDVTGLDVPPDIELRRLRIGAWRILYAVHARERWVWVLALRRRPPYDYEDLGELAVRLR